MNIKILIIILGCLLIHGQICLAKQPNLVVLTTGGTIAGQAQSSVAHTYKAAQLSADALVQAVPELQSIAHITSEQVAQVDSSNMTIDIWKKLAEHSQKALNKPGVDGIIITHGTDTLEETAYFLNLILKTNKPVVLVGSMRPANALSADGSLNLFNAAAVAASPEAKGKGALVVLNDNIYDARDVTKVNGTNVDAFSAPNSGFIGTVHNGRVVIYHTPLRKHTLKSEFAISDLKSLPKVSIIYAYADEDLNLIKAAVESDVKGIIVAGTGNGSISEKMLPILKQAIQKGIIVVRSSRTGSGRVDLGTADLDNAGFLVADNLNPQKARVLLMLAISRYLDRKAIQDVFFMY